MVNSQTKQSMTSKQSKEDKVKGVKSLKRCCYEKNELANKRRKQKRQDQMPKADETEDLSSHTPVGVSPLDVRSW